MNRIFLFLITHIALMLILVITFRILGGDRLLAESSVGLDKRALVLLSGVIGFGGSIILLCISKGITKRMSNIAVINQPNTPTEKHALATGTSKKNVLAAVNSLLCLSLLLSFSFFSRAAESDISSFSSPSQEQPSLEDKNLALLSHFLPEPLAKATESNKAVAAENCHCVERSPMPETLNKQIPVFGERYDWLKLTSDEWLKGDLLSMYEEVLEFDSEELNVLSLDWESIAELRSKGLQSVRLIDGSVMEGWISMKDNVVTITSEGKKYEYDSLSIMTIASPYGNSRDLWDGDISIGINFNSGNSETLDTTFTAAIQRRTASNRLKMSFSSNFSESTIQETGEKNITADSKRFTSIYDFFYKDMIFLRPLDYEYFSDSFQNVDGRHTVGVAIGYPVVKEKGFHWDITAGPGYQKTTFSNVQEGESEKEQSFVLSFGTVLGYEINENVDIIGDYQLQLVNDLSGKAIHQLKFGLDLDLVDNFDIDLTSYLNRTAAPRTDDAGITPYKNDYRFVVSLGYSF